MLIMDHLEQKCHDLESKVRRLEEERNETLQENEDLQDQIDNLRKLHVEQQNHLGDRSNSSLYEPDLLRLTEDIARLDANQLLLNQSIQQATDKLREMNELKESLRSMNDETSCIKEDFLHLKNHLNLAARIELQTNEKMYENRLHHLEKMLEEMRHREESFLHIAEETNILKDQVDSLRELSLATIKSDQDHEPHGMLMLGKRSHDPLAGQLSLDTELAQQASAVSITPSSSAPPSPAKALVMTPESDCPDEDFYPPTLSKAAAHPVFKITGQVKIKESSPNITFTALGEPASASTPQIKEVSPARKSPLALDLEPATSKADSALLRSEAGAQSSDPEINCCSKVMAKFWLHLFD